MPLTEVDTFIDNPAISVQQHQYILHLPDTHKPYTRFFNALLISPSSHVAFFNDLRSFRTQQSIISLLAACKPAADDDPTTKETTRQTYRQVSDNFLSSRFAHPWCRDAAAGFANSKGWRGAEWAPTGRKMSRDLQEQEEKLHRLLVPIWIVMRNKMFPGELVVEEWWATKLQKEPEEKGLEQDTHISEQGKEPKMKVTPTEKTARGSGTGIYLRQADSDSDEDAELERDIEESNQKAAQVATSTFRLAAAGMLMSTMPRRKLWKLSKGK